MKNNYAEPKDSDKTRNADVRAFENLLNDGLSPEAAFAELFSLQPFKTGAESLT